MIKGINLKLNRVLKLGTITVLSFLFVFINVHAATPNTISYKSRLRNASGTAVTSATTIQFSLYNSSSTGSSIDTANINGSLLWKETYDGSSSSCAQITPDSSGYLYVNLGSCINFPSYH